MDSVRPRFTVLPFLVSFMVALIALPSTTVVKVAAHGLGFEHVQPWRRPSLVEASVAAVRSALAILRDHCAHWSRHALYRPALLGTAAAVAYLALDRELLLTAPLVFGALSEGRHAGEFLMEERAGVGAPSRENITVLSGQNLKAGAVIGRVNKGVGRMTVPTVVGTGNGTVSLVYGGPETLVGNYVVTCVTAAANGGTFSVVNPASKALPNAVVGTPYRSREINFTINDGATDFLVGDSFTFVVDTTAPGVVGTGNGTVSGITLGPDAQPGNYRLEITAAVVNGGEFKLTDPDGEIVEQGFIVAGAGGTFVGANKRQINFTLTEGATDFAVGDAFNILVHNTLSGGKVVAWDPTAVDGRDDVAGVLLDNVDATSSDLTGVIIARDATVMKSSLEWAAAITAAQKESAYRDLGALGIVAR